MFTYTVEIYHVKTSAILAQCEGSCNSQEKKYKARREDGALKPTPIGDIMNTLMKMAQKRAYVGAVIQAVGASDFYTQDIDDPEDAAQLGLRQETKRTPVVVPSITSAKSKHEGQAPDCCGRAMMVSQWDEHTWYCVKCKGKQARG